MNAEEVKEAVRQIGEMMGAAASDAGKVFATKVWPLLVRKQVIAGWLELLAVLVIAAVVTFGARYMMRRHREREADENYYDGEWSVFAIVLVCVGTLASILLLFDGLGTVLCPECGALNEVLRIVRAK